MKHGMLRSPLLGCYLHRAKAEVARYPIPNSTFPIAQAVRVWGDASPLM